MWSAIIYLSSDNDGGTRVTMIIVHIAHPKNSTQVAFYIWVQNSKYPADSSSFLLYTLALIYSYSQQPHENSNSNSNSNEGITYIHVLVQVSAQDLVAGHPKAGRHGGHLGWQDNRA